MAGGRKLRRGGGRHSRSSFSETSTPSQGPTLQQQQQQQQLVGAGSYQPGMSAQRQHFEVAVAEAQANNPLLQAQNSTSLSDSILGSTTATPANSTRAYIDAAVRANLPQHSTTSATNATAATAATPRPGAPPVAPGRAASAPVNVSTLAEIMQAHGEPDAPEMLRSSYGGVQGIASSLGVPSLESGLAGDDEELERRRRDFGKNFVEPKPPKSFLALVWEALHDLTLIVLLISGTVSLVLGATIESDPSIDWIEGASILLAVLIVVLVTAGNDYQKERQFRKLNSVNEDVQIKVIRNGEKTTVSIKQLVVGDVVRLEVGDILPADGILFDASDMKIDESALTGESDLIRKSEGDHPFLLSGTKVMEGLGRMLVIAVGANSQAGIITALVHGSKGKARTHATQASNQPQRYTAVRAEDQPSDESSDSDSSDEDDDEPTPFQERRQQPQQAEAVHQSWWARWRNKRKMKKAKQEAKKAHEDSQRSVLQAKLERLAVQIGKLGIVMAIVVWLVLTLRFTIETFAIDKRSWSNDYISRYLDFFIVGITILVVAVPEGLPLAVTLALAFSVRKMLKDNNLVRHLDACETMGSATTICSDKTGTLTTNKMTVMRSWAADNEFGASASRDPGASSSSPAAAASTSQHAAGNVLARLFSTAVAVNSTADVKFGRLDASENPARNNNLHAAAPSLLSHFRSYSNTEVPIPTHPSSSDSGAHLEEQHIGNKTECALLSFSHRMGFNYRDIREAHHPRRVLTFSSARKRMSAICAGQPHSDSKDGFTLYCKGASEMLLELCDTYVDKHGDL
ncbi:hypothetical protein CAOG_009997 [Capsaspora owczarzaki ATCC 30864]|uniref:Cation-transporting P-type ATPase N-terminal domain-containing protein n=1 Tax=Capsaspora owczarzaki (strain ATCC 30864) TaxID=595528 RepID=A0A0D2UM61_CAPO3|nr:hypothetical protein CAOG_009997 [Capsaspora owczarzaki ATCC 30864]